jgi:hypothetical protein
MESLRRAVGLFKAIPDASYRTNESTNDTFRRHNPILFYEALAV